MTMGQTVLTKSSTISLTADTQKIKINGTAVVKRPVGDTFGICCAIHNINQQCMP